MQTKKSMKKFRYIESQDIYTSIDYSRAAKEAFSGWAIYERTNSDNDFAKYKRVGMLFKTRQVKRWLRNKKVKYATIEEQKLEGL